MTPTNATSESPIAIVDESAFFALLDLNRPELGAVLARQFTIQGVPYQFEENLDWQLKQSEETHVLSRMAHWRDLGLAYGQTGEAKYASEFVCMLNDWLDDNPTPRDLSDVIQPNTRCNTRVICTSGRPSFAVATGRSWKRVDRRSWASRCPKPKTRQSGASAVLPGSLSMCRMQPHYNLND